MKKNKINPIEFFTLDLRDAIIPKSWPSNVPLILKLQTGQHEKNYDIIPSLEPWYQSLLDFVGKQQYTTKNKILPIGINSKVMHVGAKIYDENNNIVAQGKDKITYLKEVEQKKLSLEQILIPLREKFPEIKDKFLEDFNETQQSLLKAYRPFKESVAIYDVFCDILMSGNGSSYQDGTVASLGAYSSVIDFNILKCTLNLFEQDELKLIKEASEQIAYLTPIHSVINGQIKDQIQVTKRLKI